MDLQLKVIAVAEEGGEIRSEMKGPKSVFGYICYFIFFIPVFFLLCGVGLYKGIHPPSLACTFS